MTTETRRSSLDHRRAAFAYRVVSEAAQDKNVKEDYTGLAQNLPTMILQNGLGQAVAFLMSKAKGQEGSAHGRLLNHLARWLFQDVDDEKPEEKKHPFLSDIGAAGTERLMAALLKSKRPEWARAQHESVVFATWLKRFAEALIPKLDRQPKAEGRGSDGR